jgi:uncharacterized protein (TIGR03086 family)
VNRTASALSITIDSLHRQALESTRAFVAGIAPSQWTNPTPCTEWDVRGLVNHVVVGNWWAAELAQGGTIAEVGDRLNGDVLGDAPLEVYDNSALAAALVFEREGALEAACAVSYGPVPGSVYAGHRFIDVLVHGYDIAVATGQRPELPAPLVRAAWEVIEPQLAELKASGMFGKPSATPLPVEPQLRLLTALGRSRAA